MEKESTGTESTVTHPDKIDFSKDQFDTVWTWNLGNVFLNVQIQVLVKFPQKRSGNCEWPIYLCFFLSFPENKMEWIAVSFEGSLVRMGWGKPISLPSVRYNYSMWHQMCQGLNSHDFHIFWLMVINPIVGVYIPIIRRFPIKGGMTIPNIRSLDPTNRNIRCCWRTSSVCF